MKHRLDFTPEQREENMRKAALARQQQRDYAEKHLQLVYEDENYWRKLASQAGYRLPNKYKKFNTRDLKRCLKAIGRDVDWLKDQWGVTKLTDIHKMNPTWTILAICGVIMEDSLTDNS